MNNKMNMDLKRNYKIMMRINQMNNFLINQKKIKQIEQANNQIN